MRVRQPTNDNAVGKVKGQLRVGNAFEGWKGLNVHLRHGFKVPQHSRDERGYGVVHHTTQTVRDVCMQPTSLKTLTSKPPCIGQVGREANHARRAAKLQERQRIERFELCDDDGFPRVWHPGPWVPQLIQQHSTTDGLRVCLVRHTGAGV